MTDDLIKRSDALSAAGDVSYIAYEIRKKIQMIPSADRPQGTWIDWLGKGNEWECSVCKCSIESHGSIAYDFCPMCGAPMMNGEGGK